MSRLSFKESEYFHEAGADEDNYVEPHSNDPNSDQDSTILQSAYELYGINANELSSFETNSSSSAKSSNKKLKRRLENASKEIIDLTQDSITQPEEPKSSRKKRKKRKLDKDRDEDMSQEALHDRTTTKTSNFLTKFLSIKREAADVPEPPEIEPANDSYLKMFQDSFQSHIKSDREEEEQADEDSEIDVGQHEKIKKSAIITKPSEISLNTTVSEENSNTPAAATTFALQLFNLPYRITTAQVLLLCQPLLSLHTHTTTVDSLYIVYVLLFIVVHITYIDAIIRCQIRIHLQHSRVRRRQKVRPAQRVRHSARGLGRVRLSRYEQIGY